MMCGWSSRFPGTEQFGKRGHVDHWQGAVRPSRSQTTHGRWHKVSNGLSIAVTFPAKKHMTRRQFP